MIRHSENKYVTYDTRYVEDATSNVIPSFLWHHTTPILEGIHVAAHNAEGLCAKLEFPLIMLSKNNTFQNKSLNLNHLCS